MQKFTVQDILNARPSLGVEILTVETVLIREESGYSVTLSGYYSLAEIKAIAGDIANLNTVFAERPEESTYAVYNEAGEKVIAILSYREASEEAGNREALSERGERFEVKAER